jgi:site-specific DNA recombinase
MRNNNKIENQLQQFGKGKQEVVSETGIQNCVIYTRVSSKEQADTNQSLEWQKKFCDEYAIKHKLNISGYFGGTYESAKSDERKEFNRMLKFVKNCKQPIRYILVYSLDRFSRTGDSAIYISSELKKTGVNIMAVSQPIDSSSHAGSLQQNIQFIFSKYDNDLRRQKTIDGMREKLLRGEWIGHCPTGYEYDKVRVNHVQKIIINEKGALVKQAFDWKLMGLGNREIARKLEPLGLKISFQLLTDMFQNPFYCGYMANTLLNGEVVKGNHPIIISEELFLKVHALKDRGGYKQHKENENLPLKSFIYDFETEAPFTGYHVKKKNLYYYKANRMGVKINRSIVIMHDKFKELLKSFTISDLFIEPLKVQLINTMENLSENNSDLKKSISAKVNDIENNLYDMEKNHALGKIRMDIFEKFSAELMKEKKGLTEELEKLNEKLSNPKELINFTLHTATKLPLIWASSDYYKKQIFQNMLFPKGLAFDAKINHYRTTKSNFIFKKMADLSRLLEGGNENTSVNFTEVSSLVAGE